MRYLHAAPCIDGTHPRWVTYLQRCVVTIADEGVRRRVRLSRCSVQQEPTVRHAEGREDSLSHEVRVRHARKRLHEVAQQSERDVAVSVLCARLQAMKIALRI